MTGVIAAVALVAGGALYPPAVAARASGLSGDAGA
jgi:hypothetical protein